MLNAAYPSVDAGPIGRVGCKDIASWSPRIPDSRAPNCATGSGTNSRDHSKTLEERENLNHKQGLIKSQISLCFIMRVKYVNFIIRAY